MTIDASLNTRLRRVERKRERMRRNGVVHRVGPDGLIRARPRLIRLRFPVKSAIAIVLLFMAFKALVFAQGGEGNYALKLEALQTGSLIDQAGAVLMQADPVTVALGGYLQRFFF